MSVVKLLGVSKTYQDDAVSVAGLRDVTLEVRANRFTVISGPSGSGKTTLLNVIGCIDRPNSGGVVVAGQDVLKLSDDALSDFRLKNLGFIFQNFNLLPVLTVQENVEYPLTLAGVSPSARRSRVAYLLKAVGLSDRAHHRPGQLSGGQRQRVAIARALVGSPKIVLADEPTANLDSKTGEDIIELMRTMQREFEISFIFSSHDPQVLAAADDSVFVQDGAIVSTDQRNESQESAA